MRTDRTISQSEGSREAVLPPRVIEEALREHPLLRGLIATAAGFYSGQEAANLPRESRASGQALFAYCAKGALWCDASSRLHALRKGALLVVAPGYRYALGHQRASAGALHWARAAGPMLPEYLRPLGIKSEAVVLQIGEEPQLVRLFGEVLRALEQGHSFPELLAASNALAYLLARLIQKRQHHSTGAQDAVGKVAEAIIFMSEHLDEPLRVSSLAKLASLSPDYFSHLFRLQTGSSPREYLHLLRIHKACQWLSSTTLSVKEIADRLGYQDQFHFSRKFKAFQGVSPSEYRNP